MRTLAFVIAVGMLALGAVAQGRIRFANDNQHLVYWAHNNQVFTGGSDVVAELYAGSTPNNLALVASQSSWSATPGQWTPINVILPNGYPGGTTTMWYMQVRIRLPIPIEANSQIFQVYAGSGSGYNSILATGSPSFSTWAAGAQLVEGTEVGALGAIPILVPEPTCFGLAGLGAAALLVFRRRT
jgi:hypothetical protein